MLLEMSIKNYVLIERQLIAFEPGLNVITGETGAGKSLVIDALSAVTGGKFSKEDIRTGEEKASIEALFSLDGVWDIKNILEEYGIESDSDNSLVITREVNAHGKSVCRLNGQIVTLSILKRIAQYLVDIVGQNEYQLLFNSVKHGEYVDSFGSDEIYQIKRDVKLLSDKLAELSEKLKSASGSASERERKLDMLRFQVEEIESARLKINEDEELRLRRHLLINAEKLLKGVTNVYDVIFSGDSNKRGALDMLSESAGTLRELTAADEKLGTYKSRIEEIMYQLEDIKGELRVYRDNIEFNDNEIDFLEERLDQINKLKRKYGSSIEEVLAYRDNAAKELQELMDNEKNMAEIESEIEKVKDQYIVKARLLSETRKDKAKILEKLIEKELQDLNMYGSRFVIKISQDENVISANGIDKIEFMISPNPGEPEKALSKIASGGEMSRVMLAIKNAFSEVEKAPCVVFDEVDAGVGGQTANMVGQKIKAISKNAQILCITHLPQIASLTDNHIFVDKKVQDNKTYTEIKILNFEERVEEIARMLGGNENIEASMEHAKQLVGKM
ncbi:MAG: DNA repair protein RecN [Clostridia bacterium]|jgi:DNA repair protein RecN (Recombination protein N)|nr:DNA repair protein RecN [Clostridia bacterium]